MIATTSLGSFIVNLGHLSKIPCGGSRVFQIGRTAIAAFHTRDGNVFVTESTCPHQRDLLADGLVGAQRVICPHGVVFDLSNGQPAGNACRPLRTYPAMINEHGEILVGIEAVFAAR